LEGCLDSSVHALDINNNGFAIWNLIDQTVMISFGLTWREVQIDRFAILEQSGFLLQASWLAFRINDSNQILLLRGVVPGASGTVLSPFEVVPVPEPASAALCAIALGLVAFARRLTRAARCAIGPSTATPACGRRPGGRIA